MTAQNAREKAKKNIPGTAIAYLFSFLLFITLTLTVLCFNIKFILISEDFMLARLDSSGYYEITYNGILESYENIGVPLGIPGEAFEQSFNVHMVRQDVNRSAAALYSGNNNFTVNADALRASLENVFGRLLPDAPPGEDIDSGVIAAVQDYCVSLYESVMQIPFAKEISSYITKIGGIINLLLAACIATTILFSCILVLVKRSDSAEYIFQAVAASGLLYFTASGFLILRAPYRLLNLGAEPLYRLAVDFAESGLSAIFICGIVMLTAGIAGTVILIIRKKAGRILV